MQTDIGAGSRERGTRSIMKPPRLWVALFVVLYMVIFGGWAVTAGNKEFLFYAVIMVVLIGALWGMDRRVGFSTPVLWGLAVWGLLHMAGGTVPIPESVKDPAGLPKLYSMRPWPWFIRYDQFVHAFGFGVATLAAWEGLRAATRCPPRASFGLAILMVCVGMGLGALNEVIEFTATLIMPETNVGGYTNTGWDLVSNLVGCTLAALWLWRKGSLQRASDAGDGTRAKGS